MSVNESMNFGGSCRVPMWMAGCPAGFCGNSANGPQLPREVLNWRDTPYCHGPCCPGHGGPKDGDPIVFQDGYTEAGRVMWCAVMPGFRSLQEDAAGFDGSPNAALKKLRAALSKEPPHE